MEQFIYEGLILLKNDYERKANEIRKDEYNHSLYNAVTLMKEYLEKASTIEQHLYENYPQYDEIPF